MLSKRRVNLDIIEVGMGALRIRPQIVRCFAHIFSIFLETLSELMRF